MKHFYSNRKFLLLVISLFLVLSCNLLGKERNTSNSITLKLKVNRTDTVLDEITYFEKDKKVILVYLDKSLFFEKVFLNNKLITDNLYSDRDTHSEHYIYDSTGKLLTNSKSWIDKEKKIHSDFKYLYSYDLHGNIISRDKVLSGGDITLFWGAPIGYGVNKDKITIGDTTESVNYKYNDNNELIEERQYTYKYDFTMYYENGKQVKKIDTKNPNVDFDKYWEYDSLGNLLVYQKNIYHKDVYSYNEYNKVEKILTHSIFREDPIKEIVYEYDEKERLIKEQITDGNRIEIYIYKYFDNLSELKKTLSKLCNVSDLEFKKNIKDYCK